MPEEMSVSEVAKRLGVKENKIRERIRLGSLPAKKIGSRYVINWADVEANPKNNNQAGDGTTEDNTRDESTPQTGQAYQSPLTIARTKREQAQAQLKLMEARQRLGELVEKKDVDKSAYEMARKIRQKLENIPARLAQEVAVETDPHAVEMLLDTAIRNVLEELAT